METNASGSRLLYDAYLLLRVPMADLERERSRIFDERQRALAEADAALAESQPRVTDFLPRQQWKLGLMFGLGLLLIIDHGDGYMSLYAHNQSLLRDVGEWVTAGTPVSPARSPSSSSWLSWPATSLPSSAIGSVSAWIGVQNSKPALRIPACTCS